MFETPGFDTIIALNLNAAFPALFLAFYTLFVLLFDVFLPPERKHYVPYAAISGIVAAFVMTLFTFSPDDAQAFGGMFVGDAFANGLNLVVLGTAFISIIISVDYMKRVNAPHGEYYSLLLLSVAGAMFMTGANDLIVVFVALELLSIPLYVLSAFRGTDDDPSDEMSLKSEESGMKYFILGAFASAFLVYGSALIFGATGTTSLPEIFVAVEQILAGEATSSTLLLLVGIALALVGLGFKVAVVPFHMWTPDVYEGAPTPVTAFMSIVAKVGGFGALLRVMIVGLSGFTLVQATPAAWQNTVQLIAAATLILGNFAALSQTNIKRLLAYSSIAHAGYILMAVAAVGSATLPNTGRVAETAAESVLVYLLAYMFTNLGAFAVVMALEKEGGQGSNIEDFVGLYNTRPGLALAMALFMFSLTGIPLTGGFLGKWLVFGATVQGGLIGLAVIGVLTSVVSAFYYIRIIVNMFLREEDAASTVDRASSLTQPLQVAIYASMAGVLIIGIFVPLATNLANQVAF